MLKITNPATEETLQILEADTPEGVLEKLAQARKAQISWRNQGFERRSACLRRFRALLVERSEALARTLTSETGKPITQSRGELRGALGRIDFFLGSTERVLRKEILLADPETGLEEALSQEPLGVIANISAWNYPYLVGTNVFVPALLAGNAVLYKPSERATLTGLRIGELLHESGVPREIFTPVIGGGRIGSELVHAPVDGIFFTGSYFTGKRISQAAAGRMIRLQLELGGKDPAYVCEDADARLAGESLADGAFYNAGQSCCAVERIYVHEQVYDGFMDSFVSAAKSLVLGDPTDERTTLGPLAREEQLEVLDRQVHDALYKSAHLLCGGKRASRRGYFFEPTILTETQHSMDVMREESFGPIIGIQKVASDEEAIALMNDTEYGLTAAVFSRDPDRGERLLNRMNTGTVYWNCCDRVSPRLPWSGRQHSGIGATLSTAGILAFVQPKAWHGRFPVP